MLDADTATTLKRRHSDLKDSAMATADRRATKVDRVDETEHGEEGGKVEKGHWLTTNTCARSTRSEGAQCGRNRRRGAVRAGEVVRGFPAMEVFPGSVVR